MGERTHCRREGERGNAGKRKKKKREWEGWFLVEEKEKEKEKKKKEKEKEKEKEKDQLDRRRMRRGRSMNGRDERPGGEVFPSDVHRHSEKSGHPPSQTARERQTKRT
jgi:hypothetical protein